MAKAIPAPRPDHPKAIGARLRLLRIAFGIVQGRDRELSQAEFARLCGVGGSALNNAEVGYKRLGLDNANRIREKTGAGLDFIYHDSRTLLPSAIRAAIEEVEKADAAPAAKSA